MIIWNPSGFTQTKKVKKSCATLSLKSIVLSDVRLNLYLNSLKILLSTEPNHWVSEAGTEINLKA